MTKPIVAIVGRQNVGKSTLLNRLVGKRIAITTDLPGTTRDRVTATVSWQGLEFTLVDTGGIELEPTSYISQAVRVQVDIAITEADVIIFLVDATVGALPDDTEIANMLRRANKPVILVVNKVDNAKMESAVAEFYQLGLGEPIGISAFHGRDTAELLDRVVSFLPVAQPTETEPEGLKIAIVGRPGVGKSTLLNAIVGKERAIIGDKPGTTRDATDTPVDFQGRNVLIIDTAGIRRRGRVEEGVEYYSILRAFRAIDRADVAVLVLDTAELVAAQDTHIAGYIKQAGKGIVVVVNKWDLSPTRDTAETTKVLEKDFSFMSYAPFLFISAKQGEGVDQVMPQVIQVQEERSKRVPTNIVNTVVRQAIAERNLPRVGTKQLRIYYVAQAEANPPTFVFFVNDPEIIHFSYERYLENQLRRSFGFTGTPIRIVFKGRAESG